MVQASEIRADGEKKERDARLILNDPNADANAIARANVLIDEGTRDKARARAIEMSDEISPPQRERAATKAYGFATHELRSPFENEVRLLRAHAQNPGAMPPDIAAEWLRRSSPQAAGSTMPGTAGGYAVAPEFLSRLLVATKQQGGVLEVADIIQTTTGGPLTLPILDDRASVGQMLTVENTLIPAAADLPFASGTLGAYTFTSNVALVSIQLMQDAAFDIGSLLVKALASRLARTMNPFLTTGSGAGQPQGVVTGSTVGVTGVTGSVTTVVTDDLYNLIASVDPVYLSGAKFMLHDATLQTIRKLKDTSGRYIHTIYNDPNAGGAPVDMILGYPCVINMDMPQLGANAKSILFGDFSQAYHVRVVSDLRLIVLRERYAEVGQVGFISAIRADARVVSGAQPVRAYQNSST